MGTPQDPCLLMTFAGRSLKVNNDFRAAEIGRAAHQARRDPEGFVAFVLQHLQWAQVEAIARYRARHDLHPLAMLSPAEQDRLSLPHGVHR
jgi:uroporphyrinogen-III decarboxylase